MLKRCQMTPVLSAFLCALCVSAVTISAQDKKPPKLRWLGQSFFVLETSQGTRIAFDPHAIDAFGRQTTKADLVLISHPHPDHVRLDVIENRAQAKVIEGVKVPTGNPEGGPQPRAQWNPVDEKFRDVRIRSVGLFHDTMQGLKYGKNTAFILEFDGLKLCHLGDLGHLLSEEQLRQIGPVDVLLIPVGGIYTLNGENAKRVLAQIKPTRYTLPMHYGIKLIFEDVLTVDEFLDGQTNVKKMLNTNELILDNGPKPTQPTTIILGWKKDQ
jgi:L-ascorbate metabolism protein UlaG (beta-lactamase superfamily)